MTKLFKFAVAVQACAAAFAVVYKLHLVEIVIELLTL